MKFLTYQLFHFYLNQQLPAGGINSNVADLTNWTLLHLNGGNFDGKQLLSRDRVEDLHTVRMPMPYSTSFNAWFPFIWEMGYGYGTSKISRKFSENS